MFIIICEQEDKKFTKDSGPKDWEGGRDAAADK